MQYKAIYSTAFFPCFSLDGIAVCIAPHDQI